MAAPNDIEQAISKVLEQSSAGQKAAEIAAALKKEGRAELNRQAVNVALARRPDLFRKAAAADGKGAPTWTLAPRCAVCASDSVVIRLTKADSGTSESYALPAAWPAPGAEDPLRAAAEALARALHAAGGELVGGADTPFGQWWASLPK